MASLVRSAAALASVLALTIATAVTAGAATPGDVIVFSATRPGSQIDQLFAVQPSGDGLKQLTTGALPAEAPALSPVGTQLAFERSTVGIFTMNVDGAGLRRLTTNGRDSYPAWSPDGNSIAFVRPRGAKWVVYVVPSSGGRPRALSNAPPAGRPSWTKAGLLIPSGGDLLRIDPATGHVLKYYGANMTRSGSEQRRAVAHPLDAHLPRRPRTKSGRQSVRRGPLPAVRPLHREPREPEQEAADDRQGRRAGDLLAQRQPDRLHGGRRAEAPVGGFRRNEDDPDRNRVSDERRSARVALSARSGGPEGSGWTGVFPERL